MRTTLQQANSHDHAVQPCADDLVNPCGKKGLCAGQEHLVSIVSIVLSVHYLVQKNSTFLIGW